MTQTNPPRKSQKSSGALRRSGRPRHAFLRPGQNQRKHGAEFADGEDGDERERIHAADVSLAVGDVHGPPQQAGSDGGENAADRALRVPAVRLDAC